MQFCATHTHTGARTSQAPLARTLRRVKPLSAHRWCIVQHSRKRACTHLMGLECVLLHFFGNIIVLCFYDLVCARPPCARTHTYDCIFVYSGARGGDATTTAHRAQHAHILHIIYIHSYTQSGAYAKRSRCVRAARLTVPPQPQNATAQNGETSRKATCTMLRSTQCADFWSDFEHLTCDL